MNGRGVRMASIPSTTLRLNSRNELSWMSFGLPIRMRSKKPLSRLASRRLAVCWRPTSCPITMSRWASARSFGMSSGWCWRSSSIVTTTSPRLSPSPHSVAACCPKFRVSWMARMRPSTLARYSSVGQVSGSLEQSSTRISSYSSARVAKTVWMRVLSSWRSGLLKTGTTIETRGARSLMGRREPPAECSGGTAGRSRDPR